MSYKKYASEKYVDDRLANLDVKQEQPDWNQNDETSKDYIKNKPFYTDKDGNIVTISEEYIPDTIARKSDIENVDLSGYATEEFVSNTILNPRNYMYLTDVDTSETYVLQIKSGKLVTFRYNPLVSIEVTTPPTKTTFLEGEPFDATGMKLTATYEDGSTAEVSNYSYVVNSTESAHEVNISYEELDTLKTTTFSVNITPITEALIDFTYTVNNNGTYTITGWKGTYNGEPSTECIVPASSLILV